jgi:ABC-type transport system involved in multi-copper enzyme maturation permease subunit
MTGFLDTVKAIFLKEMWEHFRTKRLIVIGLIFTILFIALSLYGGILSGGSSTELSYKRGANVVLGQVMSFTSFFPALMAIVISYTSIVGERAKKSLILIVSKPVQKPAVFLGKFFSSYFAIVLVYMVVMTVGYLCVVGASGKIPSAEEVGRAYGAVGFVLMNMACWVAFAMFLSASFKNPITTVVIAILMWFMVFSLVSMIGTIYYMVNNTNAQEETPMNLDVSVSAMPGENATVVLSGDYFFMYEVANDTGPIPGVTARNIHLALDVPDGNYSWAAHGMANRTGSLSVDTRHPFAISYGKSLSIQATTDINVTLSNGSRVVGPTSTEDKMGMRFVNYSKVKGEYILKLESGGRVYFEGNYTLVENSNPFAMMTTGKLPDYARFNALVNPDNAMTGYEKVLNPNAAATYSPEEGATAMAIFFAGFFIWGLLMFMRPE